jgi:TonB-dependent receptor
MALTAFPLVSGARLLRSLFLASLIILVVSPSVVCAAEPATLSGSINNSATGNLLQGARVELPALGLSALADNTGRYVLAGVPAGTHEVVVTYTGLDPVRSQLTVGAGQRAVRDFDLSSGTYRLDKFVVSGPREGNAASITAQRNADNVKNVVALDAFGNLPNLSAGEVAIRLPGVAAGLDDEGNVTGLIIRGQGAANNRITVDGDLLASTANLSRQFQTHSMTGAMFEQLEVIKGHTPDKSADSVGGTVNLVTRSPLSMKEKRRITYNFSARLAPTFGSDQVKLRRDHPAHPMLNLSYQEVFDALGGERNLGIAVNAFYSENVAGGFRTIRDYQNTTSQPAYLYTWATQDYFNNRKQASVNAKVDYRLTPSTRLSFNAIYNDAFEPFNRLYEVTALTGQTVATLDAAGNPTGTGAILPNYSATFTQARGVAASIVRVDETMYSFHNRTRATSLGGVHELGALRAEWTATYSRAKPNLGVGGGGSLTLDLPGVGWKLDRSQSDLYPTFTQTEGPDYRNIANYRPNGQLNARHNTRLSEVTGLRGDLTYTLPTSFSSSLKGGFSTREQVSGVTNNDQRWNYLGGTRPFAADPSIVTWMSERTGFSPPLFETASMITFYKPNDPTLWVRTTISASRSVSSTTGSSPRM